MGPNFKVCPVEKKIYLAKDGTTFRKHGTHERPHYRKLATADFDFIYTQNSLILNNIQSEIIVKNLNITHKNDKLQYQTYFRLSIS